MAQQAGYLVDNASWEANAAELATMPYQLSAEQLLAGSSSGYSLLAVQEDGTTFAVKYAIDASDVGLVTSFLETLDANTVDVQVFVTGFEQEDSSSPVSVDLIDLSPCTSAATCEGFFSPPTDQVCLNPGLCIESSVVNEDAQTLTTTIVSDDASWIGVGFSTPGGGMTGGGAGSDMFVCSSAGLQRFLVTARSNPANSAVTSETLPQNDPDDENIESLCVLDVAANTGRMTFTRGLAEAPRAITVGLPQAIIWARGPGEQALTSPHDRRGEVRLDLTNLSAGASVTKREAEWILWCHIVFMSVSWGLLLPLAVVIANRTRNVTGSKPGMWFQWHKVLSRLGWTFSTMGVLFIVYYVEVYADEHLSSEHAKLGVFVAIAGFLQPISAVLRPHPPKGGWPNESKPISRILFEAYHKGVGWTTMICGMVNVFLGARLAKDLDFEAVVSNVPVSIGFIGSGLFAVFFLWSIVQPDNVLSKTLVGGLSSSDNPSSEPADNEGSGHGQAVYGS